MKCFNKLYVIILIILFTGSFSIQANDKNELNKEQKKRLEQITDSIKFSKAQLNLENLNFIIHADRVTINSGRTFSSNSSTNFIKANDGNAMVQLSSPYISGINGMGGITVEGSISSIKKKTDKKGNFFIEFMVMGSGISARITINLPKNSNEVIASVYPNFNSDTLTVYGTVKPYDKTTIFEGRKL